MKRYDSYKDSGIEWIGEIPGHWEVKRFKYLFLLVSEKTSDEEGLPKIGLENIESWTGKFLNSDSDFEGDGEVFTNNDILFGKLRPYLAKVYLSEFSGKAVGDIFVFRTQGEIHSKYGSLLLLSKNFIDLTTSSTFGAKMPRVSWEFISSQLLPLPPLPEQTAIARYLDRKTAELDELIADKRRLLGLYEEEKTAIINQAVTKGLHPDVPMKDSGVEWLGEVPGEWGVKKLKWVHQTTSGGTPKTSDSENYDGEIPWLRTLDLNNHEVFDCEIKITEKALSESSAKMVSKNSVLVAMYGGAGTIGKSGLLRFDAAINQAICAILPNEKTVPEYLHYFIMFFRPYWMVGAEGTRRDPNISQEDIKNKEFIFPPIEEQRLIVHHIQAECARIDAKKAKTEKLIELLAEYRTALISEVVTGKVKVVE